MDTARAVDEHMLIRVWFEPGDRRAGFRARLMTSAPDAGRAAYATAPDQVVRVVASWLEDLVEA